jgi:hypothetical protein
VFVVRRGIEFLSHVEPPWQDNVPAIAVFPGKSPLAGLGTRIYGFSPRVR